MVSTIYEGKPRNSVLQHKVVKSGSVEHAATSGTDNPTSAANRQPASSENTSSGSGLVAYFQQKLRNRDSCIHDEAQLRSFKLPSLGDSIESLR